MRKVANETNINRGTVRLIARVKLDLRPYKMKEAQNLTGENKRNKGVKN